MDPFLWLIKFEVPHGRTFSPDQVWRGHPHAPMLLSRASPCGELPMRVVFLADFLDTRHRIWSLFEQYFASIWFIWSVYNQYLISIWQLDTSILEVIDQYLTSISRKQPRKQNPWGPKVFTYIFNRCSSNVLWLIKKPYNIRPAFLKIWKCFIVMGWLVGGLKGELLFCTPFIFFIL